MAATTQQYEVRKVEAKVFEFCPDGDVMDFKHPFAIAMNFFSYWFSDKIVLKMYKAQEVDDSTAPQFVGMVRELAQKAGIPMPKVYLIDEDDQVYVAEALRAALE